MRLVRVAGFFGETFEQGSRVHHGQEALQVAFGERQFCTFIDISQCYVCTLCIAVFFKGGLGRNFGPKQKLRATYVFSV
jgi:hypothetical protein